jgi:hypothetical protein
MAADKTTLGRTTMRKREEPSVRVDPFGELVRLDRVQAAGLSEALDLRPLTDDELRDVRMVETLATWVELPFGDGWTAAYRITSQDGAPIVAEVRLYPAGSGYLPGQWGGALRGARAEAPRGGITAAMLRRLGVGAALRAASRAFEQMRAVRSELPAAWPHAEAFVSDPPARRGPGRPGMPDHALAELARDYLAALGAGSRSPAIDVARRRRLSPARVRDLMFKARRRGILTPATMPGRHGGDLTARGRALLENVPGNVPAPSRTRPKTTPRQPTKKKKTPR